MDAFLHAKNMNYEKIYDIFSTKSYNNKIKFNMNIENTVYADKYILYYGDIGLRYIIQVCFNNDNEYILEFYNNTGYNNIFSTTKNWNKIKEEIDIYFTMII